MPTAVHRICPACGDPTTGAEVDPVERVVRCDLCDASCPILLLPPLLFVTGASDAGKTTLYKALVGTVREALLIDQDLLWSVNPAHDDPATGYRQFRGLMLHLAERLAKNGLPVVVEGSCMPDQYEALGERWYFSKTAYIAVVCSDRELERRLRARRPWRDSSKQLDGMLAYNRHLREHGPASSPPIGLLDTTGRSVTDCAAELHDWIRREVAYS
jgi:chloramphenicol 3-O-phosphotransferase